MLKDHFQSSVGEEKASFQFNLVYYGGEPIYHVTYITEFKKHETFRMNRDENGQWKIIAQVLPTRIFDLEIDLNDAIELNQDSN